MAQGIDDAELAQKLQERFRTARLEHFQLEPGVKASSVQPPSVHLTQPYGRCRTGKHMLLAHDGHSCRLTLQHVVAGDGC